MIEEALHIISDPGHLVAEFTFEFAFLFASVAYTRWSVRREHRKLDREHRHERSCDTF